MASTGRSPAGLSEGGVLGTVEKATFIILHWCAWRSFLRLRNTPVQLRANKVTSENAMESVNFAANLDG